MSLSPVILPPFPRRASRPDCECRNASILLAISYGNQVACEKLAWALLRACDAIPVVNGVIDTIDRSNRLSTTYLQCLQQK